jgi:hypothetical protein
MILDAFFEFTGGTVPPGSSDGINDAPTTGTQTSSKIIDLHMAGIPVLANNQGARDLGIGDDPALKILVEVTTTFTVGTSLQVNLQGAPDNGSGAPGAFTTWYGTAVIAEANLTQGQRLLDIDFPRPPPGVAMPRFLQLQYITVGTHTTGKLNGSIVLDRVDQIYNATNNAILGGYPSGVVVAN